MCESTSPVEQPTPSTLEELVEPLESPSLPDPAAQGSVLTTDDGACYHLIEFLKTQDHTHVYNATADDGSVVLWLYEGLTEEVQARLRHEHDVLKDNNCSMFPSVIACFDLNDKTYLVTEPLPDDLSLEQLLNTRALSFNEILSLLAQVAFSLTRLHESGWVHLGIRPSVIFPGKPVRIGGFSDATRIGEKPARQFSYAGYSPPELLTEEPVDPPADIYAVGALLFHAVNGKQIPETGPELSTWEPSTPFAGVPQILTRCLGSKESRYSTMEELHRDLLRLKRRCSPTVSYSIIGATSIGLESSRTTNQDAYGFLTGQMESDEGPVNWAVACVSDGMGGMAAGEVASDVAVRTVLSEAASALGGCRLHTTEEQAQLLKEWAHKANEKVCAALEKRQARGGCTLVCVSVIGMRMALAHVGDCRLYRLREGNLSLLTRDHSVVMALVLQGELTLEEIRNHPDRSKVTRSLGDRQPLPDYYVDGLDVVATSIVEELRPGDTLLLCSDGLWEPVQEEEMKKAIQDHAPDLHASADAMLKIALDRGAPDNATVVLLRLDERQQM